MNHVQQNEMVEWTVKWNMVEEYLSTIFTILLTLYECRARYGFITLLFMIASLKCNGLFTDTSQ